jgi:hypothetical protein
VIALSLLFSQSKGGTASKLITLGGFALVVAAVAGLLQATSLPFIVTATQIGVAIGTIRPATGAALVAAGLLSVVLFPLVALGVARGGQQKQLSPTRSSVTQPRPRLGDRGSTRESGS